MLDSFRKISRTWFGKLIGAFLIVGLAGFGISNVIFDIGSNTVAKVGDEEISARDFQRAYTTQVNQLAQQIGRVPSPQEAVSMGIPSAVINRLGAEAAIAAMAEDLGIGVSDDRLGKMLREDPSFSGTLGQFERENFVRVLQQNGFTEAEYFELQARAARRQQLVSGLFGGGFAPAAAVELVARYSADTRTVDYFVLNAQSLEPIAEPTEEELAAYLAEHQAEFRTPETRTVDMLVFSPATLAATKTISEEAIAAEYERTKASRVLPEQRHILQVPLSTPEQQALFEEGKAAGRSFDELVAEAGLTPTDLGILAETQVTDPQLAAAAFGLTAGDFAVIQGVGGKRAVAVSEIETGGEVSLDAAREEIRQALATAEARTEYVDMLDQIEELRAAFQPLEQIAERFELPVDEVTLTATGGELSEIAAIPEGERERVASAVFQAEEGKLAPTVVLGSNLNIWFDLQAVEQARDQTLDEVREQVAAELVAARTEAALAAKAEEVTARLEAGESIADIAAELNQFPILSPPITRSGDGTPILNQDVATAVFAGGPGHTGSAKNADGDYVVFQVVEVTPPAEPAQDGLRDYVRNASRESLYSEFVSGLLTQEGLRINRQTFDQLIALDATTGQ